MFEVCEEDGTCLSLPSLPHAEEWLLLKIHVEGKILCSKNCCLMEHFRLLQTKVQDWGVSAPNMTVVPQLVSDTTLCCMWHNDFCVPQKTSICEGKVF